MQNFAGATLKMATSELATGQQFCAFDCE